jgi:hypothetical protein
MLLARHVCSDDLSTAMGNGRLTEAVDRAGVINDALVLARAGYIETPKALSICQHLSSETDYVVWASALNELARMSVLLTNEYCFGEYVVCLPPTTQYYNLLTFHR